jgi:hypothetical protein
MAWLLVAGLAVTVPLVLRFAAHRRTLFTVSQSEPISTMHGERSKRQTAKTKAALRAATSALW